ncbi:MAG: hypothetical protein WC333_01885 [Dehalococcoidia bacterium]|jgi:hypothetical protein
MGMKLYKALKLKKSLVGEIAKLKQQIAGKNSYMVGSKNAESTDVLGLFEDLQAKIDKLVGLKFTINEANKEIQSKIYVIGEYKALIAFLNGLDVTEGSKAFGYSDTVVREYKVHMDETKRDDLVHDFQKRIDAIQEEIDVYNYTTDIPWDEAVVE